MPVPIKKVTSVPSANGNVGIKTPLKGKGPQLVSPPSQDRGAILPPEKPKAWYRIAPELRHMAVGIDSLTPDPMNARLHPEQNMEAIRESLATFGQLKPIVVRKQTSVVIAGNGTLAAAKSLGWDEIAVHFVELTEGQAAAYGVADNRTAELAEWDNQVLAALDKLIVEAGLPMTGWSADKLQVLREADWVRPVVTDEQFAIQGQTKTITLTEEEYESFDIALTRLREREGDKGITEGQCVMVVCNEWLIPPAKDE